MLACYSQGKGCSQRSGDVLIYRAEMRSWIGSESVWGRDFPGCLGSVGSSSSRVLTRHGPVCVASPWAGSAWSRGGCLMTQSMKPSRAFERGNRRPDAPLQGRKGGRTAVPGESQGREAWVRRFVCGDPEVGRQRRTGCDRGTDRGRKGRALAHPARLIRSPPTLPGGNPCPHRPHFGTKVLRVV